MRPAFEETSPRKSALNRRGPQASSRAARTAESGAHRDGGVRRDRGRRRGPARHGGQERDRGDRGRKPHGTFAAAAVLSSFARIAAPPSSGSSASARVQRSRAFARSPRFSSRSPR